MGATRMWQCQHCGENFYGDCRRDCPAQEKAEEPPADVSMLGMVVPTPGGVTRLPLDRLEPRNFRLRVSDADVRRALEGIPRSDSMGQIRGTHASVCGIFSGGGCSCNGGLRPGVRVLTDLPAADTNFALPDGDGVALQCAQHPIAPKSDAGKPKIFRFFINQFPMAMREVALHMERGNDDPGHVYRGWMYVDNGFYRYTDAMQRHQIEEVMAEDPTTEEEAAIAVAANALIRLELLMRSRRLNLDTEPGP